MSKSITGTEKINKLCMKIRAVTDEDISEVRNVIQGQSEYVNPLKMASVQWQRELSDYNTRVLDAFCALRDAIKEGEKIQEP